MEQADMTRKLIGVTRFDKTARDESGVALRLPPHSMTPA
jgi:hypothetical protein